VRRPLGVLRKGVAQVKTAALVLEVLLQRPGSFSFEQLQRMAAAGFTSAEYQSVLETAVGLGESSLDQGFANLLATRIDQSLLDLVRRLSLAPLPATGEEDLARYCRGVVKGAVLQALNQEKIDLMAAMRRIDADLNPDAQSAISRQLVELETERRALMKS
jgi:hypothetical protein